MQAFSNYTFDQSIRGPLSVDLVSKSHYGAAGVPITPPSSPKSKGKVYLLFADLLKDVFY